MSGVNNAICSSVKYVRNPQMYYAERLHKTMKGPGTDDDQLIRIIVSHSEVIHQPDIVIVTDTISVTDTVSVIGIATVTGIVTVIHCDGHRHL